MAYLVESKACEHAALRRLYYLTGMMNGMFESFKLAPYYSWFLLEMDMDDLVPTLQGDVDILMGELQVSDPEAFKKRFEEWQAELPPPAHPTQIYRLAAMDIAEQGGIQWPPKMDYLVGVEAKCSFLHSEANEITVKTVRSKKSSPKKVKKIREQVQRLLDMGFNKIALLDLIANPPASGINSQAWVNASGIATASERVMSPILKGRLPEDSLAGHWSCSIGAVAGGDETMRGAGGSVKYREPQDNVLLEGSETHVRRQELEKNLSALLGSLPQPRDLPVLFINCKVCRKIHRSYLNDECNSVYDS